MVDLDDSEMVVRTEVISVIAVVLCPVLEVVVESCSELKGMEEDEE